VGHDTRRKTVSANFPIPRHLVPLGFLQTDAVQVVEGPDLRLDDDKKAKKSEDFPGRLAYRCVAEFLRGYETKILRDGKKTEYPVYERITVTVWCEQPPAVKTGDYVVFHGVMVGQIKREGVLYFQAFGVQAVES
jgi:hypothetical protein